MKYSTAVKLFAVAVVVAASLAANTVQAQSRMYLTNPGHGHHHDHDFDTPKLGFYGYTTHHGMVVTRVMPGTEASRIGLERGDVIVSINGQRICHEGDYERILRRSPGYVDLRVRDVRGRGIITVHAHLDNGPSYYNRPVVQYRNLHN